MKKLMKHLIGFLCCVCLSGMTALPVLAEAKASAAAIDILVYQPENFSWDGTNITVTGYFANKSDSKDITRINSATFSVFDKNDKKITETTLNSSSLSDVKLAPGERWSYTVVRSAPSFQPENFDLSSGFKAGCSADITVSTHGKDCSFCQSRGELTFSTEDTMSQEEYDNLVAKLRQAFGSDDSSSTETGGSSDAYTPYVPYMPLPDAYSPKPITCGSCNGAGSTICSSCNGLGYKEVRENSLCLVLPHSDCPGNCGGSCHTRNDYYNVQKKCTICNGSGRRTCHTCSGRGTY